MKKTWTYVAALLVFVFTPGALQVVGAASGMLTSRRHVETTDKPRHPEPFSEGHCAGLVHTCLCHVSGGVQALSFTCLLDAPAFRSLGLLDHTPGILPSGHSMNIFRPPIC